MFCTGRNTGVPSLFTGPLSLIPSTLVVCTFLNSHRLYSQNLPRDEIPLLVISLLQGPFALARERPKDTPGGNHRGSVPYTTATIQRSDVRDPDYASEPPCATLYLYSFLCATQHCFCWPPCRYARTCVRGENSDKSSLFGENKKKKRIAPWAPDNARAGHLPTGLRLTCDKNRFPFSRTVKLKSICKKATIRRFPRRVCIPQRRLPLLILRSFAPRPSEPDIWSPPFPGGLETRPSGVLAEIRGERVETRRRIKYDGHTFFNARIYD